MQFYTQTQTRMHARTRSVIPLTLNKLVVAVWLMQLSPPPSFLLNHTHADLPYPPCCFAPLTFLLSYHVFIIYPPLLWLPFYAPIHLSMYPDCSSPPLSLLVSHRRSAIENLHMIVMNDFDLFARLPPPPPFTLSLSHPLSTQQPAAKWPKCLH